MALYNINHPNSKFRVGDKIKVKEGCGFESGCNGVIVEHFQPADGYLDFLKTENGWIPVRITRGKTTHNTYMSSVFLINKSKIDNEDNRNNLQSIT
jgi:hypothetical protein